MWAAAIMVFTAGSTLKWAASPLKAEVAILKEAATSIAVRTAVVIVADSGRRYWRWRRGARVGGILAFLDGVRSFHRNSTYPCRAINTSRHPEISIFSPAFPPRVPDNPIIFTIFCAIAHCSNTMVQLSPTSSRKNTLKDEVKKENIP